jgi:hypothetical protein
MTHRTICAAIIAVLLIAGTQIALHCAIDAVAKSSAPESRLFQPELRPSDRVNSTALARAMGGLVR